MTNGNGHGMFVAPCPNLVVSEPSTHIQVVGEEGTGGVEVLVRDGGVRIFKVAIPTPRNGVMGACRWYPFAQVSRIAPGPARFGRGSAAGLCVAHLGRSLPHT